MLKQIIVREVHIPTVSREQKVFFEVLMKEFIKTEIPALIDAGNIFRVTSENSEIRLLFQNNNLKNCFFGQLNSNEKILFEKLEKKQIYVQI